MEATIRVCRHDDIEQVMYLQHHWESEAITYGYVADTPDMIAKKLGNYYHVAEVITGLVGFVAGTCHVSEGLAVIPAGQRYLEIDDVYVLPEYRNAHIGTRLLNMVMTIARQQGIDRFLLYSSTKDVEAMRRFYQKYHFHHWNMRMFI